MNLDLIRVMEFLDCVELLPAAGRVGNLSPIVQAFRDDVGDCIAVWPKLV